MSNLPPDKQIAYDNIVEGKNVFVTGVAGTGKSYLLKHIIDSSGLEIKVTATTGIAAVNVRGQTIHSFAGVGLARGTKEYVLSQIKKKGLERIKKCRTLVIDEISMMSDDLFIKLDYCFREVRGRNDPFGGVQLIVFGDFLQLPPVRKGDSTVNPDESNYRKLFCFETELWKECNFVAVELTKVYRQSEQDFVDLLNNVRTGNCTDQDLATLERAKYDASRVPEEIKPVVLTATNARCDKINDDQLSKIKGKPKRYKVQICGPEWKTKSLIRDAKIAENLELKKGTQVILTVNEDQERGLVNGSTGVVTGFRKNGNPVVKFTNGRKEEIVQHKWEAVEYDPDSGVLVPVAEVYQIPLRLAWAITIHKSQGMTIPYVYAEMHNIFTEAQVYVALSRAKDLNGLFIAGFDRKKIKVNPVAKNFYENLDQFCDFPQKKLL